MLLNEPSLFKLSSSHGRHLRAAKLERIAMCHYRLPSSNDPWQRKRCPQSLPSRKVVILRPTKPSSHLSISIKLFCDSIYKRV